MNAQNFLIGIVIFILCLVLTLAAPTVFVSTLSQQATELLQYALILLGVASIIIGAIS